MKAKILKWANDNRVLIAALSVVGSFAGLVFSSLDLQTSWQEKKRKEELERERE